MSQAQTSGATRTTTVSARIFPIGGLDILSRNEVAKLRDASGSGLHALLRRCALAVLTSGNIGDDPRAILEQYPDFDIQVLQQDRGINKLLVAVVRDIVYVATQLEHPSEDLDGSAALTQSVFEILRNARILKPNIDPTMVVCWGGHSISRHEYDYTKATGYQLGLRGLDICTGCGPGAMKGPMKGATIAHAKQRRRHNRYIGITEPGIIAAESPNPIVNHLVIMPDIEKRLEAFVRIGHGIVVFPGGVGTAEEILYLLGILLHPDNAGIPFPLVFSGPRESAPYFEQIDRFLRLSLGDAVAEHYEIVVDDPARVAKTMVRGLDRVLKNRLDTKDAFFFNWALRIPLEFQQPFRPTHEAMRGLQIRHGRPLHELAAALRRAFSGIVSGNVKEEGVQAIERNGPFDIDGDADIMRALDKLLQAFVHQHRMKLPGGSAYVPCYRVVTH